jgi:A/G-specific adenine glycosylase
VSSFRNTVYRYYLAHGRHTLPWRLTRDPYRILVSEIMLQQTQVTRVMTKYPAFLSAFPDIPGLAEASLADVLGQWQGLGYNRRALALHALAKQVQERYGGRIPRQREALRTLPGIGEATAGSLMAFAFNKPVVFIETNIRSVFLHHFFRGRSGVEDGEILPLIDKHLDRSAPRKWYWALMDYGVYLKGSIPNPSRSSAHYRRQSPFSGSDRQVRGRIIRELLASNGLTPRALWARLKVDKERGKRILASMAGEGLVTAKEGKWRIA